MPKHIVISLTQTEIKEVDPLSLLYLREDLTRDSLALMLGVARDTVDKWAAKRRNPPRPVRRLAAEILNRWQREHKTPSKMTV
ncbi:MAG: hypothetical protein QNJ68_11295 [Microcoleaceae cyanobacterium MO_207.B10]|nr:hypothetical protein [Microcoleaceae cyanobacterium MO_207.B10]